MLTTRKLPVFFLLLMCAAPLWSQETPSPQPSVPPEFSSPRATMETFLGAFYVDEGADLDLAATCLDLSQLPAGLREAMGRDLAVELKEILDRTELIDVERISSSPDGPPWSLQIGPNAQVVISRGADGRWLFSRETIDRMAEFLALVEGHNIVEGVEKPAEITTVSGWLRSKIPPALKSRHVLLESWQWIGLAVLVLTGFILNKILVLFLLGPAFRLLKLRFPDIPQEKVRYLLGPLGLLAMLLLWWFGLLWLGLPVSVLRWYASFVEIALIVVACLTVYRFVDVVSGIFERRAAETENRFDDLLVPLIRKSLKILVVIVGIVLISQSFGRDLTGLLAGLGIGGLALALAAQDTLGNLFGSLTVLLDRPFHVGDWIKIDSVEGTVEEVGFRSTRIRTFYDSLISLPNSHLTSAAVDNLGVRNYRRWSTMLGLAYETPPDEVEAFCEGVRELIRTHPDTRKDYFHVYFNGFGDFALEIMLYVFFICPDWGRELQARHALATDILRLAADLGVEFAYPTQTLYLRKQESSPRLPERGEDDRLGMTEEERARITGQ